MGKRHAQQNRPPLLQTINFSASQRLYRQSIVDSNVGRRRKCVLCGRCQRTKGTIFASFALDFHAAFCARVPYAWEFHVYFIVCVCAKKKAFGDGVNLSAHLFDENEIYGRRPCGVCS
jgi:ferredoxin